MAWVFDDGRPIYAQLVEQLQLKIVSGVYPPGEKLPSVRELAAEAAVNPNTMQKAFAELEKSGLVITQGTNGRVVTQDGERIQDNRQALARQQGKAYFSGMERLGYARGRAMEFLQDMAGEVRE